MFAWLSGNAALKIVGRILGAIWRAVRSAPTWLLVGVSVALFYEGIPPPPFDRLPLIGEFSWIDGRVDRVRKAADERCRLQKIESKRLAERADQIIQTQAARRMGEQLADAQRRLQAAESRARDYEHEIDTLPQAVRDARRATPADDRRVAAPDWLR